jgi:Immunity protein 50
LNLKVIMDQENAPPVPVANASLLVSAFGYWPTFHDGEVHRALLDRGGSGESPSVTLVMHAFDTDNTVDEKGYYRVTTSVLVTLRVTMSENPNSAIWPRMPSRIPQLLKAQRA